MLVPQKKASPIVFTLLLQERQSDGSYSAYNHAANQKSSSQDEFLIYTKHLSFYDEYFLENPGQYEDIKNLAWEGEIIFFNEAQWITSGRMMAFRPFNYNNRVTTDPYGLQSDGSYNIYMLTNGSQNKDVVRVGSNTSMNSHAFTKDRNGEPYDHTQYDGNEYRSVIFDLAHYRPYRFAAQIKISDGEGGAVTTIPADGELLSNERNGSQEESVDDVLFSYKPGQEVDILIDVTSFKGSDGRSVHPFGEHFGTEFDIYIDAPMLEIDYERINANWLAANNPNLSADKLRKHPTIPGRFIYTVERKREDERVYGNYVAFNKDEATSGYDEYGHLIQNISTNQTGERKSLPFKKTAITIGGDIKISSDTEKVVFWEKRFSVDTKHIAGNIYYEKNGVELPIPKDAFVAFVRLRTGARIGVVTITTDGQFELNLRDEYQFTWEGDSIDLHYTDANGVVYNFNYTENGVVKDVDLSTLYNLVVVRGEDIVLTEG